MSEYYPDRWVIVKIEGTDVPKPYYRVFGTVVIVAATLGK